MVNFDVNEVQASLDFWTQVRLRVKCNLTHWLLRSGKLRNPWSSHGSVISKTSWLRLSQLLNKENKKSNMNWKNLEKNSKSYSKKLLKTWKKSIKTSLSPTIKLTKIWKTNSKPKEELLINSRILSLILMLPLAKWKDACLKLREALPYSRFKTEEETPYLLDKLLMPWNKKSHLERTS